MKECPYNHSFIHEQYLYNGILQIMDLNKWMKFTNSYYLTGKIYYNGTGCNFNLFHTPDEFLKICSKFTNKEIFKVDENQNVIQDKDGEVTKLKYDNT